jgi:ribosomal-protein-alanine N-acetyltransferase
MRITTDRLILRPWTDADRAPFAAMSTDAQTMAYLSPLPTRALSDAWIDRHVAHLAEHGFCHWAVERRADGAFLGAVGLAHVSYTEHFTPAVEIGWRIARAFWGQGYAPEAARASLRYGFETIGLPQIVANASVPNIRSQRVMSKLGMTRDLEGDFDHPRVPQGDPLRRQVLYRLSREAWLADK